MASSSNNKSKNSTSNNRSTSNSASTTASTSSRILAAKETFNTLQELSRLLNTGLDPDSLALCVQLCENGANPELGTGEDATLAGYFSVHNRPPAFEGCDGQPYTVSMETERTPDLNAPVSGYLVFPRWAETGLGIVGHVESPLLWRGRTRDEVLEVAGRTTLQEVQRILNEAIVGRD